MIPVTPLSQHDPADMLFLFGTLAVLIGFIIWTIIQTKREEKEEKERIKEIKEENGKQIQS